MDEAIRRTRRGITVKLEMTQKQELKLTPQMLQSMEILQMSTQELEAYLQELVQENPAAELSEPEERPDEGEELWRRMQSLADQDNQNRQYVAAEREELDPLARVGTDGGLEDTLLLHLSRQLERLHTRRTNLDEAVNFCTLLQKEPVSLNELDVEQTLARLTAKEEQGVSFVNIEQTDRKAERVRGALVGAGLFTAIMLLSIGIMAWAFCVDPQDVPPLPLLVVLFGIPAGCIIGTLKVLVDRLKEIGKGEEDAYRNY